MLLLNVQAEEKIQLLFSRIASDDLLQNNKSPIISHFALYNYTITDEQDEEEKQK